MKVSKLLDHLSKYNLQDEVQMIVDNEIVDILSVERRKTPEARFIQHKAVLIPNYRDIL